MNPNPGEKSAEKSVERYKERGVSSSKEDVHNALLHIDKGIFPGAFCKIVPDYLFGDLDYCNIMHADGAGTKASLAYLYWKETGDLSIWKGIAQDAVIMNTEDILCVGALGPALLSSTIGRNKFKIPGEIIKALIEGTEEILDLLGQYGMKIYSTGGETADLGDLVRTVLVDTTLTTRMPRREVIDNAHIEDGDFIVGLSSSGKALYELEYNSGIGSNGLSSARHDILHSFYTQHYPESFDPQIPKHLIYSGSQRLLNTLMVEYFSQASNSKIKEEVTIGKLMLSPTRTYAPILVPFIQKNRQHIHGMVHCSGGGQTKILHFINHLHVIKDSLFNPPPLFQLIQNESGSASQEMYSVFNMGHRMEVYGSESLCRELIEVSHSYQVEAQIIGRVEKLTAGKRLSLYTPENTILEYGWGN